MSGRILNWERSKLCTCKRRGVKNLQANFTFPSFNCHGFSFINNTQGKMDNYLDDLILQAGGKHSTALLHSLTLQDFQIMSLDLPVTQIKLVVHQMPGFYHLLASKARTTVSAPTNPVLWLLVAPFPFSGRTGICWLNIWSWGKFNFGQCD